MKKIVSQNVVILILGVSLCISLIYNIKFKSEIKNSRDINIIGTFSTESFPNYEYFVFTTDGVFYNYANSEIINKGKYEVYENIITLKSHGSDEHIVYGNNKIYYFNEEEKNVFQYIKVNKTPIFINLEI